VGSVGEVQPGHVHAEAHEVAQDRFRVTCWTDRADNFCPAICPAICPTNVRCDGRRVNGRTGDFPSRLSFFQVVPTRICVGLIIVYGELLFSRHHGHSKAISSAQKVAAGVGRALPRPRDQRSRCHASLYGAYLLVGSEV
jgi:hypothetical protein